MKKKTRLPQSHAKVAGFWVVGLLSIKAKSPETLKSKGVADQPTERQTDRPADGYLDI